MIYRSVVAALALCAVLACVEPAHACINTFQNDIQMALREGDRAQAVEYVKRLETKARSNPTLEHMNDAAVGRLLIGGYAEAIEALHQTEQKYPGKAIVAANLGTAYELSGNLDEALRWISEGVERDPREHSGSEWLHVEILKARLALVGDPKWLESHTVLGLDTGTAERPVTPTSLPLDFAGKPRDLREIRAAISYQLHERTQFVKPPDLVVADLYATEGDLLWLMGKSATLNEFGGLPVSSYESALEWGSPRAELMKARVAAFNKNESVDQWLPKSYAVSASDLPPGIVLVPEVRKTWTPWRIALLAFGVLVAIGTIVTWRKSRKP